MILIVIIMSLALADYRVIEKTEKNASTLQKIKISFLLVWYRIRQILLANRSSERNRYFRFRKSSQRGGFTRHHIFPDKAADTPWC